MGFSKVGIGVLAALGASVASAAAPELQHVNGLLVLPNVRVVQAATPSVPVSSRPNVAVSTSSARIFMDPVTGVAGVGEVTAADAAELTNAAKPLKRERSKATVGPAFRTSGNGAITGVRLADLLDDNDIMPYSVVRKDKVGDLHFMCVQGEAHAHGFVNAAKNAEKNNVR